MGSAFTGLAPERHGTAPETSAVRGTESHQVRCRREAHQEWMGRRVIRIRWQAVCLKASKPCVLELESVVWKSKFAVNGPAVITAHT